MNSTSSRPYLIRAAVAIVTLLSSITYGLTATPCLSVQDTPQLPPIDKAVCRSLERDIRRPSALPLDRYEEKLGTYLRNFCYRDPASRLEGRQAHPRYRALYRDLARTTNGPAGVSAPMRPVLVWYSPEMYDWLKANRPETRPAPGGRRRCPTAR